MKTTFVFFLPWCLPAHGNAGRQTCTPDQIIQSQKKPGAVIESIDIRRRDNLLPWLVAGLVCNLEPPDCCRSRVKFSMQHRIDRHREAGSQGRLWIEKVTIWFRLNLIFQPKYRRQSVGFNELLRNKHSLTWGSAEMLSCCPWLILFKFWRVRYEISSSLCLHYIFLQWCPMNEEAFFWLVALSHLCCDTPARMTQTVKRGST